MPRPLSKIAPDWWDYTTLDAEILADAAKLSPRDLERLSRPGFRVVLYDTLEEFYLAEALEYINAWRQSTADNPAGICGPIGPTEQLPLVARLVNDLDLDVRQGHFWGMDEWVDEAGVPVPVTHPLSFARADRELCFHRIRRELRMPDAHLHFPTGDLTAYSASYDAIRCVVMQGGQGEVKHWAFNDPPRRKGRYKDAPPDAGGVPQAQDPRDRPAPHDDHPERPDIRRRAGLAGADPGGHGRARRNLEGREGFDLAGRQSRQPLRHAAHGADDLQAAARRRRCPCRCWPIIPTCSSISTGRASARWRPRCTEASRPACKHHCPGIRRMRYLPED